MTRQEILAIAKPILFNTEMVRAILGRRKTVTRRVIKPQPEVDQNGMWHWKDCQWMDRGLGFPISAIKDFAPCQPGDYLYVRETWCALPVTPGGHMRGHDVYYYKADGDLRPDAWKGSWRPSIHMPKEAARIFLRVTEVRVERLQDINDAGVVAEGLSIGDPFDDLWNSTIKKADLPLHGWDVNPWVWVIEFEQVIPEVR